MAGPFTEVVRFDDRDPTLADPGLLHCQVIYDTVCAELVYTQLDPAPETRKRERSQVTLCCVGVNICLKSILLVTLRGGKGVHNWYKFVVIRLDKIYLTTC